MITTLPGPKDSSVQVKYCSTCGCWRVPRVSHCGVCDNCVELHDHHCVWLNNCIGRRNYRYFIAFVATTSALALYTMALSIYYMVKSWKLSGETFARSLKSTPVGMILTIVSALGSLYPLLLLCAHTYFMCMGRSTHEFVRIFKNYLLDFISSTNRVH